MMEILGFQLNLDVGTGVATGEMWATPGELVVSERGFEWHNTTTRQDPLLYSHTVAWTISCHTLIIAVD